MTWAANMARRGGGVSDIMSMMLYLADESAKSAKETARSRSHLVTTATIEKLEWDAFKAKLRRRAALLKVPKIVVEGSDMAPSALAVPVMDVTEEDDSGELLGLIGVLEAEPQGVTLSDIVRQLQRDGVLSREFTAAAREQTKRLLKTLRGMNRIWQDHHGRWALLGTTERVGLLKK